MSERVRRNKKDGERETFTVQIRVYYVWQWLAAFKLDILPRSLNTGPSAANASITPKSWLFKHMGGTPGKSGTGIIIGRNR